MHLPALIVVLIATGLVRSTATKGTVRMLVGLVTLLLTWTIAGIVTSDGVGALIVAATVAAGGIIALNVWTPLLNAARSVIGWVRIRDRVNLLPPVLEARARVVGSVDRALGTVPR